MANSYRVAFRQQWWPTTALHPRPTFEQLTAEAPIRYLEDRFYNPEMARRACRLLVGGEGLEVTRTETGLRSEIRTTTTPGTKLTEGWVE